MHRLWEKEYPGGHDLLSKDIKDIIHSNFPQLVLRIENSCSLWAHLMKWNVVDQQMKEDLTNISGNTEQAQVRDLLLNEILRGPVWKYKALLYALVSTQQFGVIHRLQEDVQQNPDITELMKQTKLLKEDEELEEKILKNFVQLVQTITLGPNFWALLMRSQVLSNERKEEIRDGKKRCQAQQIRCILEIVLQGPKWKYHRFLHILCKTGHEHIYRQVADNSISCAIETCKCRGAVTEVERRGVTDKYLTLTHCTMVGELFWAYLLKYEVLDYEDKERIKCDDTRGSMAQIRDLLDLVILRGPQWKYHALIKSLVDMNSEHLVQLIGENPDYYKELPICES